MKLKVKIDEETYNIEVGDVTQRPIMVLVDGESYCVWPEENQVASTVESNAPKPELPMPKPPQNTAAQASTIKPASVVRAPIPGVITAITVQPGSEVAVGDELCKLEAMKMNNSIRSNRVGKIAAILVNVGQQVKHNDPLIEFAEE
jgi:biotin carboxyl carrier protein